MRYWGVHAKIGDLMMEAASTSDTSVNFYHTTRSNNPEDSHLCGIQGLSLANGMFINNELGRK
jgi:hypothetical protein